MGYDISCVNNTDGIIEVVTSGGSGNYQISIDGGLTFPYTSSGLDSIFNLSAGNYSVVAQDENACLSSPSDITLTEPSALSIDLITESASINCFGFSDGEITVQVSGGAGLYSYSLDGGASTQPGNVFSNLASSNITIEVNDGNGCTVTDSYFLDEPSPLTLNSATVISDFNGAEISCFGASDGVVEVDAVGGTGTYSYSFITDFIVNEFTSGNQIVDLSAGLYTVQLIDENQCYSNLFEFEVFSPAAIIIDDLTSTMTTCFSNCDAELTTTASGGTPPLTYTVSGVNYGFSNLASNLCQGLATVVVEDVNGCITQANNLVGSPPLVDVMAMPASDFLGFDVSCPGLSGWHHRIFCKWWNGQLPCKY